MAITLYGIPNCDTVKKARAWLAGQGVDHAFHDFKKSGVPADRLDRWMKAPAGDKLLNRQGTTWRKLDPAAQSGAETATGARALMLEQPSVIKAGRNGHGRLRRWRLVVAHRHLNRYVYRALTVKHSRSGGR
jgi:arsenate reductase